MTPDQESPARLTADPAADPTQTTAGVPVQLTTEPPVNGPLFVLSCVLLPVIWGVLVHRVFNKLRRTDRPAKLSDSGWPDYQI